MRVSLLALALAFPLFAQPPAATPATPPGAAPPGAAAATPPTGFDELMKHVDDLMWHTRLGDIAEVDKVEYTSLPPVHFAARPGAGNPLIIRAYTFIPRNLDRSKQQPLIVFCHQGIHANE